MRHMLRRSLSWQDVLADGATYQEALANAEAIIQEWLETARQLSRAIPEPKGRLIYA